MSKILQSFTLSVSANDVPAEMSSLFSFSSGYYKPSRSITFSRDFKFYCTERDVKYELEGDITEVIKFLQDVLKDKSVEYACLDYNYGYDDEPDQMVLQEWKKLTAAQSKIIKQMYQKQQEDNERAAIDRAQAEIERATEILRKAGKL